MSLRRRVGEVVFGISFVSISAASLAEQRKIAGDDLPGIQKRLQGNGFLSVDFTQVQKGRLRQRELTSHGQAIFAKPDKFRWILTSPKRQEILYDGKTLIQYNPEENNAISYTGNASEMQAIRRIIGLVVNTDQLLDNYKLIGGAQNGDHVALTLVPKNPNDLKSLELIADLKTGFVSRIKLMLSDGGVTDYSFSNPITTPVALSAFSLPSGVHVKGIK